jgi:FSR family fosmidomycin resistance protein-like MFS transporter
MHQAITQTPSPQHPDERARPEIAVHSGIFQTRKVLVIAGGHFTHDLFTSSLAPLLPLIIDKLSLSLTLAGMLASLMQLPALIDPFLGALADRGKLRWLAILAPSISATGMLLVGVAPSYALLALLVLAVGFSSSFWHTSTPALVRHVSGNRIGRGMSFFMLGGSLAFTLGPLVILAAVGWWTLEGIWRLLPLALGYSALLFWQTRDMDGFQTKPAANQGKWAASWRVLKPVMLPVTGIILSQAFMQVAFGTFLPTFITGKGASLWVAGGAFSIYELAGAIGALYVGNASDRLGRRRILVITLLIAPLMMLMFVTANGWIQILALVAVGLTSLATSPVLMALVLEYSSDHPATANGLYFAVAFAGRSLIIILVGALADHVGLQAAFKICALLGLLALPFARLLPGKQVDFCPESL